MTTTTAAPTTTIDQSQQCQQFEVIGVSSETSGVYELSEIRSDRKPENLVWKKPKEDRYIFNTGNSLGWRIGTEGHLKTGRGHYISMGI